MQNKETLETEIYETLQINELAVNKMNKFIRAQYNQKELWFLIILKQ